MFAVEREHKFLEYGRHGLIAIGIIAAKINSGLILAMKVFNG